MKQVDRRRVRGKHDFSAFASSGSERKSGVRTVSGIRFLARRERFAIVVQGSGFLYNMVRTIVGTLIDVGRGRRTPLEVRAALEGLRREAAGPTAPAAGLYLLRVLYPRTEGAFTGRDRGPHGVPGVFQY